MEMTIGIRKGERGRGSLPYGACLLLKDAPTAVRVAPILSWVIACAVRHGRGGVRWRCRGTVIIWTYPRIAPRFLSPVLVPLLFSVI